MATSRSGGRRRPPTPKRNDPSSDGTTTTLFSTPGSDIVPGEIVVQLDADAAASITESIPSGTSMTAAIGAPSRFGVPALDAALAKVKAVSVTRVHRPAPPTADFAMAEAAELATTFLVRLADGQDAAHASTVVADAAGVAYAEPVVYRETYATPNDPGFPNQWGLTKVRAPQAWDRTTGSPNVVVAVLDTGIDLDHPELASLLVPGRDLVDLGPSPTPPAGYRFEGDWQTVDDVPQDEVGHGTHVAGTIACRSDNGTMVAGMTWSCRLMPVKVLTRIVKIADPSRVSGVGRSVDIAAGIRWAVDHGARVINMSLGSPSQTNVERDAIAYAIAHNVVVCAAMGNGGPNAGASFPAAYPDVIAVGATDSNDALAGFSQVGPHIDVCAPGVGILSTVWNNGTTTMQGTSMATPHVAGLAALILSCNGNLTARQVGDLIRQTAVPLRRNAADPVPNDFFGHGRIDAKAALDRACPRIVPPTLTLPCRSIAIDACARPTVPVICRSLTVACRSLPLHCRTQPVTCLKTAVVTCTDTAPVRCAQVSQVVTCPTTPVRCVVSGTVRCPTALVCGPTVATCGPTNAVCGPIDPGVIQPGPQFGMAEDAGFDPYGADGGEGWDDDGSGTQGGGCGGGC